MKSYLKESWFGLVMYSLFGLVLSIAGVSVTEKPIEFLLLLGILIAVDLQAFHRGLSKGVL